MAKKSSVIQEELEKYKTLLNEKDKLIKDNEWYKVEYEKIRYGYIYRIMQAIKKVAVSLGIYKILKTLFNLTNKKGKEYVIDINGLRDMNKRITELENTVERYKVLLAEKDEMLKNSKYYQEEYEKITYSFSYRFIQKIRRILIKIKVYPVLKYLYDLVSSRLDTSSLPGYKYYRFKRDRGEVYKLDSNNIKSDYVKGLVSIVLPIYNGADLVGKLLDSILEQTYKKFEIIIVNDGSIDDSLRVVQKYAKKDKRIVTIIDQVNQTLPVAISAGFRVAKGEYYMWVGHDDILHKNCIEMMLKDLEADKSVDFVYPNVRLIDENGDLIVDNKWYNCDKNHPEYVILPHSVYELNVIKNNYIAPIALYKSIVVRTLGDFSSNRFTTEDYEYWMRVNNIFNIKHLSSDEPIFDYRRHSKSLTSQAKELNISKKTDQLMLFEDFRRDYLMMPLIWVIDCDNKEDATYLALIEQLKKAGHLILNKEDAFRNTYSNLYKNQVYLYIGDNYKPQDLKSIPDYIYKVLMTNNQKNVSNDFDLYLTMTGKIIDNIGLYKGWFKVQNVQTLFSFIDVKVKHKYLKDMEDFIENKEYTSKKKLSVVICTYKCSEKLNNAIESAINQTASKDDYELLIINNDITTNDIYDNYKSFKKKYNLPSNFIKYYEAPIKGLSFARNVGLFGAQGKAILYLDDDSIAFKDLVEQMIKAYDDNPNAGVIGGQIILKLPKVVPEIYLKEKAAYWSQLLINGTDYKRVKDWYQFPYGANYSVNRKSLLKMGGFRTGYGRVGHNFVGGEEVVVSSLIQKLGEDIVLDPLAKVYHDVDELRYTEEHITKTDLFNAYTRIKMELDLYTPVFYLIKLNNKREIKLMTSRLNATDNKIEKIYINSNIKGHKKGMKELKSIKNDINRFVKVTKDSIK